LEFSDIEEYIIDNEVMSYFSNETYLMHPLPRNAEISEEVDDDKRAIYYEQAHNGIPIRMALLYKLLNHK